MSSISQGWANWGLGSDCERAPESLPEAWAAFLSAGAPMYPVEYLKGKVGGSRGLGATPREPAPRRCSCGTLFLYDTAVAVLAAVTVLSTFPVQTAWASKTSLLFYWSAYCPHFPPPHNPHALVLNEADMPLMALG